MASSTKVAATFAPTTPATSNAISTSKSLENNEITEIDIIKMPQRHFNIFDHLSLRNIILILTIIAIILVLIF
jgi:hypothetical protein